MGVKAQRDGSVAIIGAGDYIGSAIARRFASEGFLVKLGRRNGDKLEPLVKEIEASGGRVSARSLDAREPEDVTAFLQEAENATPLQLAVFNIGANVNFPIVDTTDRVFRKVWEMACFSGFVTGREAARIMANRGGKIFFTGATASRRGGSGYAAFAAAKFGLRAVAESMARELWLSGIHVAHLIIDAGVDTAFVRDLIEKREGAAALTNLAPDQLMSPEAIADAYWSLFCQPRSAWTFEQEIRPYRENW
jgi:NAD(P)-dependent dehydrogenase (short-subunit alcohol dehydrogenase family)